MKKGSSKINLTAIVIPVMAVIIALLMASVVILLIGKNPLVAYYEMLKGAFGSLQDFTNTIVKITPLILTGLAVGFGFRAGVFNIGAEGQMSIGALFATIVGMNLGGVPSYIAIPLTMLSGMLAGSFWASIAGFLKAKTGAHEVITTIMLNWIAYYLGNYMVAGPLSVGSGTPKSPEIVASAKLPTILRVQAIELTPGIFIAILMAIIIYILLEKTSTGYEIKAVGFNPYASEYGGISISKNVILAMAISGALAGLAGSIEVMGLHHRYLGALTAGKGFDGISISLIGQNHPIGIIFAALLIGSLRTGSNAMQFAGIPKHIVMIIQGIVIFLVAADRIVKTILAYRRNKVGVKQ